MLLLLSLAILFLVFIHKNIITVSAVMLFVASIVLGFPNTVLIHVDTSMMIIIVINDYYTHM